MLAMHHVLEYSNVYARGGTVTATMHQALALMVACCRGMAMTISNALMIACSRGMAPEWVCFVEH